MEELLINPKTGKEYVNVPPKVAAAYLDVGTPFMYEGLKQGVLPFGTAVQSQKGRWIFNIPIQRLRAYKNGYDIDMLSALLRQVLER